jgi:hypothetical protein
MGLDVFFHEDIARILLDVAVARGELTADEKTILEAVAAGFGIELLEVLPAEPPAAYLVVEEPGTAMGPFGRARQNRPVRSLPVASHYKGGGGAMSIEPFVNAAQARLMRHMPKVWEGDDGCYLCPIERCENRRAYLEQRVKPKCEYQPWNVWGDGSC